VALQENSRIENPAEKGLGLFLRQIFVALYLAVMTPLYSSLCIIGSFLLRPAAAFFEIAWHRQLLMVCGVRVVVHGLNKLKRDGSYIFIGNHSSYLDIPAIVAGTGRALRFIAKRELFLIPFLGWGMAAVGHIWIDRSNARKARASLTRAANAIRCRGISVVLFPEGTRSIDGSVGQFKQGSFTLALEAGIPVVPIALSGMREILPKHTATVRSGTVHLYVGDPIMPETFKGLDKKDLAQRVRDTVVGLLAGSRS
jgi:1-acyl-sn-glycerol-3-phosphate acyltransferase